MAIESMNPATGEVVRTFSPHTDEQVKDAIARAHETFGSWRRTTFAERATLMRAAADLLEAENEQIAQIMTLEMGKTLRSARAAPSPSDDHGHGEQRQPRLWRSQPGFHRQLQRFCQQ